MASTIRQRLRRFNGTDYDTIHLETELSCITDFVGLHSYAVDSRSGSPHTVKFNTSWSSSARRDSGFILTTQNNATSYAPGVYAYSFDHFHDVSQVQPVPLAQSGRSETIGISFERSYDSVAKLYRVTILVMLEDWSWVTLLSTVGGWTYTYE